MLLLFCSKLRKNAETQRHTSYFFFQQVHVLDIEQVAVEQGLHQSHSSINPLPQFLRPIATNAPETENFLGPPECLAKR